MRVGGLIRDARRSAGLTQAALARRSGTSQPTVARYESDAARPTLATLERLMSACGRRAFLVALTDDRAISARRDPRDLGPVGRRLARNRARLLELGATHGVRPHRVFGSVARGEDRERSDVDLLVELDEGTSLLDLIGFQQDAEDVVGAKIDAATVDMLKPRVRDRALAESVPL